MNLNEALKLVEENKTFIDGQTAIDGGPTETSSKSEKYPKKYLDLIVTSPVFYNGKLIPKNKNSNFRSQFSRATFSDVELKFVLLGYQKFGHLNEKECCECIRNIYLPARKPAEINAKLKDILKSNERKQKHMVTLFPFSFIINNFIF